MLSGELRGMHVSAMDRLIRRRVRERGVSKGSYGSGDASAGLKVHATLFLLDFLYRTCGILMR